MNPTTPKGVEYVASSASQISTFGECEEHWFNASILKMPVPSTDAASAGDAVHKEMENYSVAGTEPKHPSAILAKAWLAPPKVKGVWVEQWLQDPNLVIGGVRLRGRVDYIDARDPKVPYVLDFKSKGKFDAYLKTEHQLEVDTQLNIYGAWMLLKVPVSEAVAFAHGYILRDEFNPDVRLVKTEPVPREKILDRMKEVEPTLARMKEVAAGTVTADKNYKKCDRWFGGACPFKSKCFPADASPFASVFRGVPTYSGGGALLERLIGSGSSTPTPVAAAPTATVRRPGAVGIIPPDAPRYPVTDAAAAAETEGGVK